MAFQPSPITNLKRNVTILGAGLVGSLLAVLMRRRGYPVTIYERRTDMRQASIGAGRSINLAMSTRGWQALALAGLKTEMESLAIPMTGRFLHQPDGSTAFQPYGTHGEAIYSVSRGELNKRLMSLAESHGVRICFNQRCVRVDVSENILHFEGDHEPVTADLLFGADGAFSALRTSYSHMDRVSARQDYIEYGYKELNMDPGEGSAKWRMEKHALHIWPRGKFMLIALPNTDGSFTCTLFMPFEGEDSFEKLKDDSTVQAFFEQHFADAIPLMPDFLTQFRNNPVASLITTHISKWHHAAQSALIGDAAHAIVPFYGQGMNAGFEDCTVLSHLMDTHEEDWTSLLKAYEQKRKDNGNAVAALALMNFVEMRDKVADPHFLERKKIEKQIALRFPEQFTSIYELVSFSHTPYSTVMQCIEAQDKLLGRIMAEGDFEQACGRDAFNDQLQAWMEEYHQQVQSLDFTGQ
ncbi:MAG: FAD-dependent monooxygenase [Bacteroidetes bacterium]|nr:FAD-dependent monooxygenase [Bacteroidota bacterium]MBS1630391.1 FAD-dependent monooxygenase [Bacteroidota bacterium]